MLKPWHLPILFGTGLIAGFVDSIAGGGGLITLPVLLSLGLGPQQALGTNKLQASFGSGSAAWHYAKAKAVPLKDCARGFVLSFLGAALGALAVQQGAPSFLKRAIPILLIAVAVFTLLKPTLGSQDLHPRMRREWFDLIFGLGIGFYDGFFGPGTGPGFVSRRSPCLFHGRAGDGHGPACRSQVWSRDGRGAGNQIHPADISVRGLCCHAKAALQRVLQFQVRLRNGGLLAARMFFAQSMTPDLRPVATIAHIAPAPAVVLAGIEEQPAAVVALALPDILQRPA